jgi:hypothetical protein
MSSSSGFEATAPVAPSTISSPTNTSNTPYDHSLLSWHF